MEDAGDWSGGVVRNDNSTDFETDAKAFGTKKTEYGPGRGGYGGGGDALFADVGGQDADEKAGESAQATLWLGKERLVDSDFDGVVDSRFVFQQGVAGDVAAAAKRLEGQGEPIWKQDSGNGLPAEGKDDDAVLLGDRVREKDQGRFSSDERRKVNSEDVTDLVVYDVRDLLGPQVPNFTDGPSFDLDEALSHRHSAARVSEVNELQKLVRTAAEGTNQAGSGKDVTVREINGNLVVKATPEVQREVLGALNEIRESKLADVVVSGVQVHPAEPMPVARQPVLMPVNPWVMAETDRLSTFALDVDTASYRIAGRSIRDGVLPPRHTVRMEEFVNAFDYRYPSGRRDRDVFAVHAEAGPAPFGQDVVLLKVGVRGKVVGRDQARPAHLVFVIDTSGSMDQADRLPLVQHSLGLLMDRLGPQDRVTVVAYGTQASLLVDHAEAGAKAQVLDAVGRLQTGGATHLLAGLELGYAKAAEHLIPGGVNRVVLCSDGVANVGPDEAQALLSQVERLRGEGVTFTSVGVGVGDYDDQLMEQLANRGDGSYLFVGSRADAEQAFVEDLAATRPTIAKDAKIQVDFDPQRVRRYRLIGYENRDVADADFRNDAVDAGEVGSGQSATALYEVELIGPAVVAADDGGQPDLGTVYVRYENVASGAVEEIARPLRNELVAARTPRSDPLFFLAACAAEFAEVLRESEHVASRDVAASLSRVEAVLHEVAGELPHDPRVAELLDLVQRAPGLPRGE